MRIICTGMASLLLTVSTALAAAPVEVWRVTGLSNPESVLFDPTANILYVSNVGGDAAEKDGKGFITRLSLDGKVLDLDWVSGLDAPKGLAQVGDKLYVSDIDSLVAIDTKTGAITKRYPAAGAKFLNDVTADEHGRIFVSDMVTNQIWLLDGDQFTVWLQDAKLENPNGLKVSGNKLIVASWGVMKPDFSTDVPGHLLAVDLTSKEISNLGDPKPVGNLDGLEPDGAGGWYLTDWVSGGLFHAEPDGRASQQLDLAPGSADIGMIPASKLVLVPMMNESEVVAYRVQ